MKRINLKSWIKEKNKEKRKRGSKKVEVKQEGKLYLSFIILLYLLYINYYVRWTCH